MKDVFSVGFDYSLFNGSNQLDKSQFKMCHAIKKWHKNANTTES